MLVGADEDRNPVLEIYLNQNGASLELSNLVDADFWTSANRIELDHNCGNAAVFDLDKVKQRKEKKENIVSLSFTLLCYWYC